MYLYQLFSSNSNIELFKLFEKGYVFITISTPLIQTKKASQMTNLQGLAVYKDVVPAKPVRSR